MLSQGRSGMFSKLGAASLLVGVACGQAAPSGQNGEGSGGSAAQPGATASGGVTADGGVPPTLSGGLTGDGGVSGSGGSSGFGSNGQVELRGGGGGSGGSRETSGGLGGLPNTGSGGAGLPQCEAPGTERELYGCLLDATGKQSARVAKTAVNVVEVSESAIPSSCFRSSTSLGARIRLRAANGDEWSYFVTFPGRPIDQIRVGDELDLSMIGQPSGLFFDQAVVLGRESQLVLFTRVTWMGAHPDLSAYDTTIESGAAYCNAKNLLPCDFNHSTILVKQGTEAAELRAGGPTKVGELLFTLGEVSYDLNSRCDPPSSYRYGAFRPR